jgi:hypothetical protein
VHDELFNSESHHPQCTTVKQEEAQGVENSSLHVLQLLDAELDMVSDLYGLL